MTKIEDCPLCEKPLEDAGSSMVCHECQVSIDPVSGEIKHLLPKKSIIKKIIGRLKYILCI
jgi:hypothetical protein